VKGPLRCDGVAVEALGEVHQRSVESSSAEHYSACMSKSNVDRVTSVVLRVLRCLRLRYSTFQKAFSELLISLNKEM
jgi:hypothetical protein